MVHPLPRHAFRLAFAFCVAATFAAPGARVVAQVLVTTCGQEVSGAGVLAGDLDCTGLPGDPIGAAVVLHQNGSLDLGGFTLTGGGELSVACLEPCKSGRSTCGRSCSVSNGTIVGGTGAAVLGGKVRITNTTIRDSNNAVFGKKVMLTDCSIVDNTIGLEANGTVILLRSAVTNSTRWGIQATGVSLHDSSVSGSGQVDLLTKHRPRLMNSTCGTSAKPASPGTWGVCSLD